MLERWREPGAGSCLTSCQSRLRDLFNAKTRDLLPQAVEGGGGDTPYSLHQLAAKPGRCVSPSLCPNRWTTERRSRVVIRQHGAFTAPAPHDSDGKGEQPDWAATSGPCWAKVVFFLSDSSRTVYSSYPCCQCVTHSRLGPPQSGSRQLHAMLHAWPGGRST